MYQGIIHESKDTIVFKFDATSKGELESKAISQFEKDGYKKKAHSDVAITFEKGSYTARVLLGAFYKYFKWDIRIGTENDDCTLTINRQSSGMSGGLIGVSQVKNELLRLKEEIANW